MKNRFKVTIVGAGYVGSATAQRIAERGDADVVLVDIVEGMPQGKALDIAESAAIQGFSSKVTGSNSYETTAGSDLVIITSGVARKPGLSREDLLQTNIKIIRAVTHNIVANSPDCIIIVSTNPVNAMTQFTLEESGFPRNRVLGLSGVLDGSRLATFIAAELNVAPQDISPCILGDHGHGMVVVPRLTTVKSVPITRLLSDEAIVRLVQRTVKAGDEIVELLKTGSAFIAPSAALALMADAILLDTKRQLYCSARLEGEYGITNATLDVPVKLGKNGIEGIIELELTAEELNLLHGCAIAVRELVAN